MPSSCSPNATFDQLQSTIGWTVSIHIDSRFQTFHRSRGNICNNCFVVTGCPEILHHLRVGLMNDWPTTSGSAATIIDAACATFDGERLANNQRIRCHHGRGGLMNDWPTTSGSAAPWTRWVDERLADNQRIRCYHGRGGVDERLADNQRIRCHHGRGLRNIRWGYAEDISRCYTRFLYHVCVLLVSCSMHHKTHPMPAGWGLGF